MRRRDARRSHPEGRSDDAWNHLSFQSANDRAMGLRSRDAWNK